ncbi:hypothetical protein CAC42_8199 [Sphaceloma murrayae]|uniref:Hard-surface induced protein 5 n=1 Tax=Sphaceloma murrayae TaxID=2082308 RepID=A0A2K1QJ60_9PEZI|nr:hypothetical protein CAC42_8199 [Sphaceloma murrayae]
MAAVHTKGKWPIYICLAGALLFIIGIIHQSREHLPASTKALWPFQQSGPASKPSASQTFTFDPAPALASFYDIALKHGTDKVTDHSYQDMYEKYLPGLRLQPLKMLEIGLGCDMSYGPGASYYTWLEYFPHVDLYFIEYDAKCAEQWADKTTGATIITGDQGDGAFLEKFMREHGTDFDVIVDDGGHTMEQQMTSLQHLWKAVKPGGVYFCEDLQTSYWDNYGGGSVAAKDGKRTMMQYIHLLIEDITYGPRRVQFEQVETMVHIDCSREVCGFFKRAPSELGA